MRGPDEHEQPPDEPVDELVEGLVEGLTEGLTDGVDDTPAPGPFQRWGRRLGVTLAWLMVVVVSLLVSLAYHLQLPFAGVVALETVTELLDDTLAGSFEIGRLHNATWEKVVARDVVIRDPRGREVIRIDRLAAWPDFEALLAGEIRITRVRVRGGRVTLIPGDEDDENQGAVSLADTFLPIETDESPTAPQTETRIPRIRIEGIVLDEILVAGDVPGYEGIRVEDVRVEGRVDIQEDASTLVQVFGGRGEMTGPYEGTTHIERIVGHVNGDMREGLEFYARAHRGDDRLRARLRVTIPEEDASAQMDLRVWAEPWRMATLADMEVAPGLDALDGTFRGYARMSGPVDDLVLRGDLSSEAGRVYVTGRFPTDGPLEIGARTEGPLRLAELVPAAPPIHVEANAQLTLDLNAEERHLVAEVEPLVVADVALPAFRIDAMIEEDQLRIRELEAPHVGGEVSGRGTVSYDGALDVHVSARIPEISRDPNVRRHAPGARGAVTAELDVRSDDAAENLVIQGRVGARGLRYGSVSASSVDLRGRVAGLGPAPELRASGEAEGLRIGELALGQATVSLEGGPGGYDLRAETRNAATGTHFLIDGRAHASRDALRLDASTLMADLGDGEPWRGEVDVTLRPSRSVVVDELALTRQNEAIEAEAHYRFNGDDSARVRLTGVRLDALRPLAPASLEGLAGTLDGQVTLGGDLDRSPRGQARLRLRDGGLGTLRGVNGTARLTLGDDGVQTDVALDLGDSGALTLSGPIGLDPRTLVRAPDRIAAGASLDALTATADHLDLGLLTRLGLVEELPVQGRVTTQVAFAGTGEDLGFRDVFLVLDSVGLPDWDPLRAKLHLSLGGGRLRVRQAWIADSVGPLAQAQADLPLSLDDPPADAAAFYAQLQSAEWSASARLEGRRLDRWPRPVRDMVPIDGVRLSASLTAEGNGAGPSARLASVAQFVEAATDMACGAEVRPVITVDARLDGELLEADLRGFVGDASAEISAEAFATLPLTEWIQSGVTSFPGTEIRARVRNANLADVPLLCEYGQGPLDLDVRAKNLLTEAPVLGVVLDAPHLQLWERSGEQGEARLSDEYRVNVRAGSTPNRDALSACLVMGIAGQNGTAGETCRDASEALPGELISRARFPVTWTAGELVPAYTDGATISSWSDLSEVHVEPVLTFIPGIVTGDAIMDGRIEARGPMDRIQLNGELDMREGQVQIEGLGQHLHGIRGRVELHGDEVLFPATHPLTVEDSGGRAQLSGSVGFDGILPQSLDLVLSASEFPIRREGMVLASLSGGATVGGRFFEDRLTSTVRIVGGPTGGSFDVQLPEQTAGTLQSLGHHRDVLVVGTHRAGGAERVDESYPLEIRIDAREPFQVRRTDFNATIAADLTAVYQDPDLRIRGEATIQRGVFEILGKRFELSRGGTLTFRGHPELNPLVNIDAVYEVDSNTSVTVHVAGTLAHPVIEFTSSTGTTDRAEIIALLVAGGRREVGSAEQQASQQAASFLSGITAGILTLGLRQEFGDIIPLLAIEPETSGTRVRVGFNANEIIPEVLREIITGAYIEGFLTASQATNAAGGSAGTGGVGGGVTIEFTFPYNLLMRGTYVPVDNGSLDVLFEP